MATIPAALFVNVIPNVLSAGGNALDLNGTVLTTSTRVPIGAMQPFSDPTDVGTYFGASSKEASIAAVYFAGFDNSNAKPGSIFFTQYPISTVAAYLRGGPISTITLAALQALSGTLTVIVDGYTHTGSAINLSSATSYSSAAALIQTAITAMEPTEAMFTGSVGGTFGTCTTTGTTLTLGTVTTGSLQVGDVISGTDTTNSLPAGCKIVAQLTGTAGGSAGATFTISAAATPGNLTSCTVTSLSTTLDVTVVASGTLAVGQNISTLGTSVLITSLITGTGLIGLYGISSAFTQASESMTAKAVAPTVTFDSTSGALVVTSGITGAASSSAFATGSLAASLFLTQATGAILSQGANAAVPAAFMTGITQITQNWASFMLAFDPDNGSGNTIKMQFANWTALQDNRWAFVCWDTDITPTNTVPATTSMGYLLQQSNSSGTILIYEPSDTNLAAMVCGFIASIDFGETNGRITMAFKSQSGIVATVTNETVATNLKANGYNCYLASATANQSFVFFWPGSISGEFEWADAYVNQIWLNNQFQLDLMELLTQVKSVPYDPPGYAMIEAACADTIAAGLNFGMFSPGVELSSLQISEVNNAAGLKIDGILNTLGWYFQVKPAPAIVRGARTTPPVSFWYCDAGAVQQITLDSIELQ